MVLKDGGYNRYREQGATNLGELARFVLEGFGMFISLYFFISWLSYVEAFYRYRGLYFLFSTLFLLALEAISIY